MDYRGGEDSEPVALVVEVDDRGVVGAALVAPFGVGDEGVVVVDQLASDAEADLVLLGVAEFDVGELEIVLVLIGRAERGSLAEGPGVLKLADDFQPRTELEVDLEAKAIEEIGIVIVEAEARVAVALEAEAVFEAEADPVGEVLVELGGRAEVGEIVGGARGEGTVGGAVEKAQGIGRGSGDPGAIVGAGSALGGDVVLGCQAEAAEERG